MCKYHLLMCHAFLYFRVMSKILVHPLDENHSIAQLYLSTNYKLFCLDCALEEET